ncbi:hypothetical protein BIW11_08386, partial [Tropilaelaps mercedesae]
RNPLRGLLSFFFYSPQPLPLQEVDQAGSISTAGLLPGVDLILIADTSPEVTVPATSSFVELRDSSTSPIAWPSVQEDLAVTSDAAVGDATSAILDTEDAASSPIAVVTQESQGVQTLPPVPTEDALCSPIMTSPPAGHATMTDGEAMTDLTMGAIDATGAAATAVPTGDGKPKPASASTAVGTPIERADAHVGTSRPTSSKVVRVDRATSPIRATGRLRSTLSTEKRPAGARPPGDGVPPSESAEKTKRCRFVASDETDASAGATAGGDAESRSSSSVDLGAELGAATPISPGEQPMPDITSGDIATEIVADIEKQL